VLMCILLSYQLIGMLTKRSLSAVLALDPSHFMLVMVLSRVEFYLHTFLLGNLSQLITEICLSRVGCKIGTLSTNIFVYADDIVLPCPSWYAMKVLLQS